MDFHCLSRKELQTLCKKNKIPANITNVAMADALSALPQVEALDEFLNPTEAEAGAGSPDTTLHTACRTATRRKALREEPQSAKVVSSQRPQRKTRGGKGEEGGNTEQENKDANAVPITPAARKRATTVFTRRPKKETEVVEDDEEKKVDHGKPTTDVTETPAAVPRTRTRATGRSACPKTEGTSVQRGYNTRRSVRLLEKNLSKMSFVDAEDTGLGKNDNVSEEMSSVSQQIEESADTEEVGDAGVSLQTVSNVVSEETDEVEVSSLEKKRESECQLHDSGSEVHLVSGTEIDVGAVVEAEPQEEDSSLKADSESHEISNEVLECQGVSDVDMNSSIEEKAGSEFLSEDSCDSSETEYKALSSKEFAEQDVDAPVEVTDQDDASSLPMSPVSDDSSQLREDLKVDGKDNELDVKNIEAEHLNVANGDYIQHFEPMNFVDDKADDEKDLASPEGVLELVSSDIYPSDEHQEEEFESENLEESLAEVEEIDIASDFIGGSSDVASEKDNANGNSKDSIDSIDVCVESSADKSTNGENITLESPLLDDLQEELEGKSEQLEESMGEAENVMNSASDVTGALSGTEDEIPNSENSNAAIEVCAESSADDNNVTLEPSLVDTDVQEAEENKDDSDNLEAKAQPEESDEQAAAEETTMDATSALVSGFNSHTLAEDDAVPEQVVIQKQESVTVALVHELKASDIPVQSVPKMIGAEENMQNAANMKENLTTDELHKKSMRELKMMLKKLSLDPKSNCKGKTDNNNNNVVKEVERKRTALQALPENQSDA